MSRMCFTLCALLTAGASADQAFTVLKNIPYLEKGATPALDVYKPAGADAQHRLPGLVWIHGGGWRSETRDGGTPVSICSNLAASGIVTVSISYTLSTPQKPSWPENIEQCKAAVRFLRRHAAEYGVDSENIAVGGGSAGGHLATLTGLTGDDRFRNASHSGYSGKVKAILDLYGAVSTFDCYGSIVQQMLGSKSQSDPLVAQSTAETYVDKDSPPVFIAQGLDDSVVHPPVSYHFEQSLAAAGVPHRMLLIPGAGHGFTLESDHGTPLKADLKTQAITWLHAQLDRVPAALAPGRGTRIEARLCGSAIEMPPGWAGGVTYELRDRNGKTVRSGTFTGAARDDLPAGWYLLTLRRGNQAVHARIVSLR